MTFWAFLTAALAVGYGSVFFTGATAVQRAKARREERRDQRFLAFADTVGFGS